MTFRHYPRGKALTPAEYEAVNSHIAAGQTANDILYFDGTYWVRTTLTSYLASQQSMIFPDNGSIIFGTAEGAIKLSGGRVADPFSLYLEPSSGDHPAELVLRPSGTDYTAAIGLLNSSDTTDYAALFLSLQDTTAKIWAAAYGAGSAPTLLVVDLQLDVMDHKISSLDEPTEDDDAATKKYVDDHAGASGTLDPTLGSDHTYDGQTITFTAGTNLVFGNVCYMGADGKMEKCDKDAVANTGFRVYLAVATIAEDASGLFLRSGLFRDDSLTFTKNHGVWIGDNGALVGSATGPHTDSGDVNMCVGLAIDTHKADFWGIGAYRQEYS